MNYLTVPQLKERGWNSRLVRIVLGKPDNMVFPSAPHTGRSHGIYSLARVINLELTHPEFAAAQDRKKKLSERTKQYRDEKVQQIIDTVNWIPLPELPQPLSELLQDAHSRKGDFPLEFSENRVALELLLDRMKSLESHLLIYKWHSGIREARTALNQRILAHITKHYPDLQQEADKSQAEYDSKGGKEK